MDKLHTKRVWSDEEIMDRADNLISILYQHEQLTYNKQFKNALKKARHALIRLEDDIYNKENIYSKVSMHDILNYDLMNILTYDLLDLKYLVKEINGTRFFKLNVNQRRTIV